MDKINFNGTRHFNNSHDIYCLRARIFLSSALFVTVRVWRGFRHKCIFNGTITCSNRERESVSFATQIHSGTCTQNSQGACGKRLILESNHSIKQTASYLSSSHANEQNKHKLGILFFQFFLVSFVVYVRVCELCVKNDIRDNKHQQFKWEHTVRFRFVFLRRKKKSHIA